MQVALERGHTSFSGNLTLVTIGLEAVGTGTTAIHFSVFKIGNLDAEPLLCFWNGQVYGLLKNVIIDGYVTVPNRETPFYNDVESNKTTHSQSDLPVAVLKENSGLNPAETIVTFSAGFITALAMISAFRITRNRKKSISI
jgi:hypothetical protein